MGHRVHQPHRDAQILAARLMGDTLEEVAARHGLTKQRVDQIIRRVASPRDRQAIRRARQARRRRERAEAERVEAEARHEAAVARGQHCPVCNRLLECQSCRTCGGECAEKWGAIRRHVDPEANLAHRRARARAVLARGGRSEAEVEHAHRVLSDDPPPPNRRFVVEGSRAHQALQGMER